MNNGNMPASPVFNSDGFITRIENTAGNAFGLTKREMIAMHAMAASISSLNAWTDGLNGGSVSLHPEELARESVNCADALLEELSK